MAAPTLVQSKFGGVDGGQSATCTFDTNTTTGNLIVVQAFCVDHSLASVTPTDTGSRTYTIRGSGGGTNSLYVAAWTAPVTSGGATTITVNMDPFGGQTIWIFAREVSGHDTDTPHEQTVVTGGTSDVWTVDLADTTAAETMILAAFCPPFGYSDATPAANWTQDLESTTDPKGIGIYRAVTSAGAYDPTVTHSDSRAYYGIATVIKAAAEGGASVMPRMTLLGVG